MSKLEKVIALLEAAQDYATDAWHHAMYEQRTEDRDEIGRAMTDIHEALQRFNSVI